MPNPQAKSSLDWRKALAAVLIVTGIGVIAASFLWPGKSSRRGAWSNEQAEQYQAASMKLHSLSHEVAHSGSGDEQAAVQGKLKSAKAEYDALRAELDSALTRPQRLAWILRCGGVLLVILGGAFLFMLPESSGDESP